jgi:NADPH:quinone reductase-like Zn-dependent oxidoreductase
LGADEVIDYKNEKFEEKINDVDLVFDKIGGDTQKRSIQVVKNGGKIITTLKAEETEEAKAKQIHIERYTAQSYNANLQQIADLIDAGVIKPVIT